MILRCLLSISYILLAASLSWAQQQTLDSTYYDIGITDTEDFEFAQRSYYRSYDEDNRPLVVETQRATEMGAWINWRRRAYTYSPQGDLTQLMLSRWLQNDENWELVKERNYTYDENGNILTRQERVALQAGEELTNTKRWEYTYEGPYLQTALLFQRWEDGAWLNDSRQLWNYNANELTTEQVRQRWDGMAWQDTRRRMWTYESGVLNGITEQVFDEGTGEWVNESRRGYQNSGSALWDQSIQQEWNNETGAWENVRRQLMSYNNDRTIDNRTAQLWEGAEWQNFTQLEYQMVDEAINVVLNQWNTSSSDWGTFARYQLRFNSVGRRILEQGWQFWSEQMGAWLNAPNTDRWRYFWSDVMVNTEEPLPDAACRWPNPYRAGQFIHCESLPLDGAVTLEIINSAGQVVHQQQLMSNTDFQIKAQLPYGWYLSRLQQSGQLLHVQPFVFIP